MTHSRAQRSHLRQLSSLCKGASSHEMYSRIIGEFGKLSYNKKNSAQHITCMLSEIYVSLLPPKSYLEKECALTHSHAGRGRLRHPSSSRESASSHEVYSRVIGVFRELSYDKTKNPVIQDSPPAAGRVRDIFPLRRSAILAERFCVTGEF